MKAQKSLILEHITYSELPQAARNCSLALTHADARGTPRLWLLGHAAGTCLSTGTLVSLIRALDSVVSCRSSCPTSPMRRAQLSGVISVGPVSGRVLSSEISAEAHPRGVLSRVVSSGFSCRVPQASPNPYLFAIVAQSVKAQFLADFWTSVF